MSRSSILVVGTGGVVGLLMGAGSVTSAVFTDVATVSGASVGTGSIEVPSEPMATFVPDPDPQGADKPTVDLAWVAVQVDTGVGPQPVSGYEVVGYDAPTGGSGKVVCRTSATSCEIARQRFSAYYSVRAEVGAKWVRESARTPAPQDQPVS